MFLQFFHLFDISMDLVSIYKLPNELQRESEAGNQA